MAINCTPKALKEIAPTVQTLTSELQIKAALAFLICRINNGPTADCNAADTAVCFECDRSNLESRQELVNLLYQYALDKSKLAIGTKLLPLPPKYLAQPEPVLDALFLKGLCTFLALL